MLAEVSRTWAAWGASPGVLKDPEWTADLQAAHGIVDDARKTLRVIAAVNCLHNQEGQDRLTSAEQILRKEKELPKNLAAALQKLR